MVAWGCELSPLCMGGLIWLYYQTCCVYLKIAGLSFPRHCLLPSLSPGTVYFPPFPQALFTSLPFPRHCVLPSLSPGTVYFPPFPQALFTSPLSPFFFSRWGTPTSYGALMGCSLMERTEVSPSRSSSKEGY